MQEFLQKAGMNLGCDWTGKAQDILPRVAASELATSAQRVMRIRMI